LLTYRCSRWISRHNWDRLIGNIPGFQAASAGGFTAASIDNNDPVLLVQGIIDQPRNTADLWPFYQLTAGTFDTAKISASFAAAQQANTDYFIRLLDGSGAQLSQSPLAVELAADGDSATIPFTHFVSFDVRARRIQLMRQGVVIAERLVSANAPVVAPGVPVLNLNAQTLDWNWTATDADGDPLIFTLQYSRDNGASWQTLQVGYPALSATLNTRMLPGSAQGRLRVIASDGVHSAIGMTAPFVLPRHAPDAVINGVREGERLPFGTFGSLRGLAIDAEDGSLPGPALRWNLSGPVSRAATGESFSLVDLSPGLYTATLAATDSDNQTNEAVRRFEIQPVAIPDAAIAPVLDGQAADAAYANAAFVRFPLAPGRYANARFVHVSTDLYICLSDLDYSFGEVPAVGVRIDANASRNTSAQPDDCGFFVNLDAIPFQETGNGTGMSVTQSPRPGYAATVTAGQNAWSAELRIADALVGGWNHAAGMMLAFKPHTSLPDETRWPLQSTTHQPATWTPAWFGTPPTPASLPPVANSGLDRIYSLINTQAIYLDGSASFDPDGSTLTYAWTQVAGPSVTLSNSSSASPSFVLGGSTSPVTLRFRLVVNDGASNSAPDEVSVVVQAAATQELPRPTTHLNGDGSATSELLWPGNGGDRVIVQASSNLLQWVNVASNTVDWVRRVLYRDIQAGLYLYRFYRLVNAPDTLPCTPPADNLVGWWRAEDDALDATGNNHGTLLKGLFFAPGRVGRALSFTAANQELLVPPSASLDVGSAGAMTIEGWINPADAVNQYPIAEWGDGASAGTHFWINVSFGGVGGPGSLYAAPHFGDASYFASAPGVVQPNVWQHVAFTYDDAGGVARLYLNGTQVASKNVGMVALQTSLPLNLGHRVGGPSFRGLMDEMALYNRALTSNEIRAVYLAGIAGKCGPLCGLSPAALSQNFETGTSVNYTLSQHNTAPGPAVRAADAGSTGRFLRLINDGVNSQNNSIAFPQIAPGLFDGVRAEFDFRLSSPDAPADGFAFMLIPTATYGTNGPGFVTPIAFEEPNIPGVFALGFDVHPRTEPRNDVSVHWNGTEYANVTMADANVNLTSGSFHRATVTLTHISSGALVTVSLVRDVNGLPSPAFTLIRDVFVPGLNPFPSRVEFAGRNGALDMHVDLDNIRVQYLPSCLTSP
jgi:hypothetical protein